MRNGHSHLRAIHIRDVAEGRQGRRRVPDGKTPDRVVAERIEDEPELAR